MKKTKLTLAALLSSLVIGLTSCNTIPSTPPNYSTTDSSSSSSTNTSNTSSSTTTTTSSSSSSSSTSSTPVVEVGTVLIQAGSHGTVVADKTSGNVGDTITLTVTPDEGYELDTLKANGVDIKEAKSFVLVAGENTVVATFKTIPVPTGTVTISAVEHGTVVADKMSGNVGDTITLTVTPDEGYELDTLKANGVDIKETKSFVLVAGENTVVATFKESVTDILFGEEATHIEKDTFYYWAGKWDWSCSGEITVNKAYKKNDGTVHLDYNLATGGAHVAYIFQLFYKKSGLVGGKKYTLTFNLNSSNAGSIIINGVEKSVAVGENTISIDYTEPTAETGQGSSSICIQMGKLSTEAGNVVLDYSGFSWTEYVAKTGAVKISSDENGTVTADKTSGEVGEEVNLTVTPNEGYALSTLTANGEDIATTKKFTLIEGDNTVVATFIKVTINYEMTITSDKTEYKEGDGAALLVATLDNDGTSLASNWNWDDSGLNNIGLISAVPEGHASAGANARFFTPTSTGTGTIIVSCSIDGRTISKELSITVNADYSKYTKISKASELLELLNKSGTITDKYYLDANIDLGGMNICGRDNGDGFGLTFNGVLDGRGHTISNFTVKNESTHEPDQCAGLFYMFGGVCRNIHIKGKIDANGFSGLLAKEVSGTNAVVENCLFEAEDVRETEPTDWTWQRNGVIASVIKTGGTFKNCVTSLTKTNNRTLAFAAYGWDAQQTIEGCYTNITSKDLYTPFNPTGGEIGSEFGITGLDFASSKATDYSSLDTSIWTLEDGKVPVLKHYGEEAVTVEPEVSISADNTTLSLADDGVKTATVTSTITNSTSTATYAYSVGTEGIVNVTNNNDGTFTLQAASEGETTFTVTASINGKDYVSNVLTIKVEGSSVDPSTPTKVDVLAKGTSATRFDGAGAWIWLNTDDIGMTAENNANYTVTATLDDSLDPSGNATGWTITGNPFFSDHNFTEKYVRVYVTLTGGPGAGYKTTISLTISDGTNVYEATASFTGSTFDDPNAEPVTEPTEYKTINVLANGASATKFEGAGAFIWLNTDDLGGMTAANMSEYTISATYEGTDTGGVAVTSFSVNGAHFQNINETNKYVCAYVTLTGAPVDGWKTKLTIKIVHGSVGYQAIANFSGTSFVTE